MKVNVSSKRLTFKTILAVCNALNERLYVTEVYRKSRKGDLIWSKLYSISKTEEPLSGKDFMVNLELKFGRIDLIESKK